MSARHNTNFFATDLVRFISAEQSVDLRSRILRPNQPLESCLYSGDNDESTFHLGFVVNAKILSNGTFIQEANVNFAEAEIPYRLRGMATDHDFQKQGLGKFIVEAALVELKKRNCDLLWFNARVSAEGFYRKMGFLTIENIFDVPLAGPHKIMYKWL